MITNRKHNLERWRESAAYAERSGEQMHVFRNGFSVRIGWSQVGQTGRVVSSYYFLKGERNGC